MTHVGAEQRQRTVQLHVWRMGLITSYPLARLPAAGSFQGFSGVPLLGGVTKHSDGGREMQEPDLVRS